MNTETNPDERQAPFYDLCRLCGGTSNLLCTQNVLSRYDVGYYQCPACDLIQTQKPFWLPEAYGSALSDLDTGAVERARLSTELTLAAATLLRIPLDAACTDYGGGHGILVRAMRDHGYDFRWYDTYAQNHFARGFEADPSVRSALLTCFEVWEHLPDVGADLAKFFEPGHDALLVGTFLHAGHRPGWWYYCPEVGQHVAFFSARTMQNVADRFGYEAIIGRRYTLFHKPGLVSGWRRSLLGQILRRAKPSRNSRLASISLKLRARNRSRTWDDHVALHERCEAAGRMRAA